MPGASARDSSASLQSTCALRLGHGGPVLYLNWRATLRRGLANRPYLALLGKPAVPPSYCTGKPWRCRRPPGQLARLFAAGHV